MNQPKFERARSPEAKLIRETAILQAAERLATEHGVRAVTLTDIASAVGMHKSAMLRYFETREEIFLRLAADGWREWSQDVRDRLCPPAGKGAADTETGPAAVADVLARTLTARPLFCDLLAHTPLNLERGVSLDAVRIFKTLALTEAAAVGSALCAVLPLTPAQAGNAVATATGMAGALWQMAAPGTELRRFYEDTPELAHAVVDVAPRLADILTAVLRGYSTGNAA
ncbi:TetR/AcrR family transcriptional regulator [Streptacidiphilus pinicola]|uniref:TetR/AcrR family transcriptional regulator n=1 Tax=Streptacidiphilus pinicola TaxID=2219663 RepID=A0A2X0J5I4_9ACTN|nr:TetR family transcriptional regulator [Streptacidiphilus pinicola]RAG85536.1 TetR/AcrR family transcriptional regulator [Streptacidiphilus pinicola]